MIQHPCAKINIGLDVINKRTDGYHDISSVLYPIPLFDELEITPASELSFTVSGLNIPGNSDSNLVVKAWKLLHEHYSIPNVKIRLKKVIPMGAGLGGGSSDGSFALKMLSSLFELGLSDVELENFAAQLGSDCPFFISGAPAYASGTGTTLTPISFSLSGYFLLLIKPDAHVSTANAYSNLKPHNPEKSLTETINYDINLWKDNIKNDFESSVFSKFPELRSLKETLYSKGAIYASMSGSGSSIFGIFKEKPETLPINHPQFILPLTI